MKCKNQIQQHIKKIIYYHYDQMDARIVWHMQSSRCDIAHQRNKGQKSYDNLNRDKKDIFKKFNILCDKNAEQITYI